MFGGGVNVVRGGGERGSGVDKINGALIVPRITGQMTLCDQL